jgi:riboflavin kinase/FMN adenylyltransferase
MQIARFPAMPRPRWPAPVAALGNFDGVHRGHQKLFAQVAARAQERAGLPVAMIFEPHPASVLRPDKAPPLLMTLDQKLAAFARAGLQGVAIVEFTPDLSRWEPETFVDTVLVDWLRVAEVWVGENFLFGRERSGTFTLLRALGEDRGFRTEMIEPVRYKDFVVSSTRIRRLVQEGRVPTANLETGNALLPAFGIYTTLGIIDGIAYPAVTNVGIRPTIGDDRVTVETHLLDTSLDLYGRKMSVAFVKWQREEAKFDSLDALRVQMLADCDAARRLLARLTI